MVGCSSLGTLNAVNSLTPGDGGTDRVATDIAFGSDPRQKLDIYTPEGVGNAGKAPVVVFFYGGSWNSGRRQDYAFAARALAAKGFVVVVPDYRLVPQVTFPGFCRRWRGGRRLDACPYRRTWRGSGADRRQRP